MKPESEPAVASPGDAIDPDEVTPGGRERRRSVRFPLANVVWYKVLATEAELTGGSEGIARAVDVSVTGLCIEIAETLPPRALLFLEVSVGQLRISAVGQVAYARLSEGGMSQVGLHFLAVPPNDSLALRRYCKDERP